MKYKLFFDLLNSLSSTEKRFIKLFLSNNSADKKYYRFYEFLMKNLNTDSTKTIKNLSEKYSSRDIHAKLGYIEKLVFTGLKKYYSRNPEIFINQQLLDLKILFQKKLYNYADYKLTSIKFPDLSEFNLNFYELLFLDMKKLLFQSNFYVDENPFNTYIELYNHEQKLLDQINKLSELNFYSILSYILLHYSYIIDKNKVSYYTNMLNEYVKNSFTPESAAHKKMHDEILANFYRKTDLNKFLHYRKSAYLNYLNNETEIKKNSIVFIHTVSNYILALSINRSHSEKNKMMEFLHGIPMNYDLKDEFTIIYIRFLEIELNIWDFNYNLNYIKAKKLFSENKGFIMTHILSINNNRKLLFLFDVLLFNIALNDAKNSIKTIHEIYTLFSDKKLKLLYFDKFIILLFYELIIHLRANNSYLVDSRVLSIKRYLKFYKKEHLKKEYLKVLNSINTKLVLKKVLAGVDFENLDLQNLNFIINEINITKTKQLII